jgi:hypothetical protein
MYILGDTLMPAPVMSEPYAFRIAPGGYEFYEGPASDPRAFDLDPFLYTENLSEQRRLGLALLKAHVRIALNLWPFLEP